MGSKYDIYLGPANNLRGFRLSNPPVRDSAPLVVTRFSTGETGESDLDLLKADTVTDVEGGMFQRDWDDKSKVARAIGVFNKYDKQLYPTPPRSSATAISASYYPQAKVESDAVSFIAYGAFSAGTYYNILHKVTYGSGVSTVTLPAALASNGFTNITGLTLHKKYLFVASQTASGGAAMHRYDIGANTWQDITAGSVKFFVLRNLLYCINNVSGIYSVTNEEAAGAATYTLITVAGSADLNFVPTDVIEFNGAVYISKPDGIFRFDGISATKVLNHVTEQLCVYNGAIYFKSGLWLYKFDGATISKLQFFGNKEIIGPAYGTNMALSSDSDYLYVATVTLTSGYVDGDKVPATANGLKRIYTYDGVGFLLFHESAVTLGTGYSPSLLTNRLKLYDIFGNIVSGSWATNHYNFDLSSLFTASAVTTGSRLEITASEHHGNYPNVFKSLEYIIPDYTGLISGDVITVSFAYYNGKVWSAWQTAGTITSTTSSALEIIGDNLKLYKRLKVNATITLANGSTAALKGISIRYTLQPRVRWRWQATFKAEGNNDTRDRTGTAITEDSNALTNVLSMAIKSKTPQFMLSHDYGAVKSQVNAAALSIIIKGQIPIYTDPYDEYPLVAILNSNSVWEILRIASVSYSSINDETTLTIIERGYLGITAAQINAGAEFHLCYKVYVTRLQREAPVLNDSIYNEQPTTGESQIKRQYMLELTEV